MTAADQPRVWVALQTRDLPDDSACKAYARDDQQDIWHVWNDCARYCDYHHLGGLKAPVARMVKFHQRRDAVRHRGVA